MSTETQVGARDIFEEEQRGRLIKSMRLFDLVFFGITTVVSLDTIGQISSFGAETFTWLLVLVVLFVVPYAWLMAELSGAFPQEGGPYHWMRLAFGRGWAALGAVLYWITNPLWLGGSLSFLATATVSAYIVHLDTGSFGDYVFKLAFVWVGILVAVISLRRGKWIPSIGAFVKLALVGFVSLTVVIYAMSHGVHGYGLSSFSPTLAGFLGAVPVLLFAISGFECGSAAGDEMTDARRDGPLFITRSAAISVMCYLIPILAVLLVVAVKRITGVSGFMDAVALTFSIYGGARHALVDIVAIAFVFTLLTQGSAWMMGSDRVLAAAGMDGTFPRWLGVFHSRLGTPVRVNLMSGAVATAFVVVANELTSGSAANTFAVVLTVAISTVLMSYLIIYPAAWVLRRKEPDAPRPFVVPFGDRGMAVATVLATFFALLGTWVALFPGVLEKLFGLSYDFTGTWGVSRGRFEALTLGTVAVIVLLTLVGLWLGSLERRRETGTLSGVRTSASGPRESIAEMSHTETRPGARVPRFDVLLEPVPIGPVVARNRFFQVPHCNGMGYRDVSAHAEMRAVKAEGGWAVICTEQAEIHHSSEITPFIELRIWDDQDIPAIARIADKIHEHDALAGIELCYNGMNGPNLYSRLAPMGPAHLPVATFTSDPVQARRMDLDDIADLRRWHRAAVRRSLQAGYDLVYVYAGHALGGIHHFLSRRYNDRTDAYGGSAENRMRLLREILEDTREECDGRAAVACRITVDELLGDEGITREDIEDVVGTLGELPNLWDFVLGSWEDDSVTARFGEEAEQEQYVRGLKRLTSKPVVGVGRFTSPDTMVRMVRSGVLDLIGAARPSIADPFLPKKIEEGRLEDIRECIGCNICVSGDFTMSPIRCTQNPTMGEEWRRGWHPERIRHCTTDAKVLVVGGGPAGLEAAQALGKRGYEVILAEATNTLGGRVAREARLPGMASYIRVADYREAQLKRLRNVERTQGEVTAAEILEYDFDHVAVATGARWRADGVGRHHTKPIALDPALPVLTPDDLMAGTLPNADRVVLFDDDHYYMGGVLAELLARSGRHVTLVTPAACASSWTTNTMEQHRIQRRLLELDVEILASHAVLATAAGSVRAQCVFTARETDVAAGAAVFVTARLPEDSVYRGLLERRADWQGAGLTTVRAVGDCLAPGTIAAAVWEGHRYAQELEAPVDRGDAVPFRREVTELARD